ncbi:MAG: hypothetical protein KIS91_02075 [Anaerolineae bacterium]|nr:hypothetical protein [Anaerolineae bacterium]
MAIASVPPSGLQPGEGERDESSSDASQTANVYITPTVEADLKLRNVFPELRIEKAACRFPPATGQYPLSLDRLKELLADAEQQYRSGPKKRGLRWAYSRLINDLQGTLSIAKSEAAKANEEAMLAPAPGVSPARFHEGEDALYFENGPGTGEKVRIVEGYGWRLVQEDGRVVWRPGYLIRPLAAPGRSFFARAGQLAQDDCRLTHVRLVRASA